MNSEEFLKNLAKEYADKTGEAYKAENAGISPAPTPGMDRKMQAGRRMQRWKSRRRTVMGLVASLLVVAVAGASFMHHWAPGRAGYTTDERELLQFGIISNDTAQRQSSTPPASQSSEADGAADGVFDSDLLESEDDMALWSGVLAEDSVDVRVEVGAAREAAESVEYGEPAPTAPAPTAPLMAPISLTPPPGWRITETDYDGDIIIFHLEGEGQNRVVVMATAPPENSDFSQFFPVLINTTWAYMRIESTHSVLIYQQDGMQFTLTTAYDAQDLIALAYSWL
jgi:hypothetical protein